MADYTSINEQKIFGAANVFVNQASNSTNQWFGRTACGSNRVDITTAVVDADSIISLTMQQTGATSSTATWAVTSINAGVGFSIGVVNSLNATGQASYTAMWVIHNQREG